MRTKNVSNSAKAAFVAFGIALLGASPVVAANIDLSPVGNQSAALAGVNQAGGGATAFVADFFVQPAGTGVFDPFLTLRDPGGNVNSERGFNTNNVLFNDQQRPYWNTLIKLKDLGVVTPASGQGAGVPSYAFILDANEPGGTQSLISINNLRVYTNLVDNSATVGNSIAGLNGNALNAALAPLGNLIFGMTTTGQSITLDAAQEGITVNDPRPNGGSGQADMALYIPVSLFAGVNPNSYVFLYNENGALDPVAGDGYEEWKAVLGSTTGVPDGGTTAMLLGGVMFGLFAFRRRMPV
jgi:hypothetical protein